MGISSAVKDKTKKRKLPELWHKRLNREIKQCWPGNESEIKHATLIMKTSVRTFKACNCHSP